MIAFAGQPGVRPPMAEQRIARPLVVAYGGGTNSTAMLVGMADRGIRPDLILFADTGGEKPETYRFLDTFGSWLADHDFPGLTTVRYGTEKYSTLEEECLGAATLPSLAFGWKKCSHKWKRFPQDKWVSTHFQPAMDAWAAGGKVCKAIGYDADESRRADIADDSRYVYWYPLRGWNWGRPECIAAIQAAGLPLPGKSACFFCPASTKIDVLRLRQDHPCMFERAVEMERRARAAGNLHVVKGLGRHWSWEALVNADQAQMRMFPESVQIPCGCFDGDED